MGAQRDVCYWKLAKEGMSLVLNNKQEEAEALFKMYPESNVMYSGYATTTFMDALMTFEDEKLNHATQTLKEMERRCSGTNWFRIVRAKNDDAEMGYAEHLENQIIRADAQMYLATLTFLQQDISAYFKGGWILRKSWRHYQATYNEITSLYKQIVGDDAPSENTATTSVAPDQIVNEDNTTPHQTDLLEIPCEDVDILEEFPVHASNSESSHNSQEAVISADQDDIAESADLTISTRESESSLHVQNTQAKLRNGYIPKSHTMHFESDSNSTSSTNTNDSNSTQTTSKSSMKKSQSVSSTLARYNNQFQKNLGRLSSPLNSSLSYISSLNPFNTEGVRVVEIDKETITRLMCGISFGYGLLQLGMSLLPPSIMRLTSFFGFQGNRKSGLAILNYARNGTDMRSPMATLALLWYHTIVRPFYALDGTNVQAGVEIAARLIDESMLEYANSSIFLFFRGRVDRLKSDIPGAILSFEASIQNSKQREMRILAQHEVAWCHLIQLDYPQSFRTFFNLKQQSRWSRSFYTYLYVISAGANETLQEINNFEELRVVFGSTPKGSQLEEFLARRFKICPSGKEDVLNTQPFYWRLLIYELLYLWNSMPSCNIDNINGIIQDCEDAIQNSVVEPFAGLSDLMAGNAYCILNDYTNGIRCFKDCLQKRKGISFHADDAHVSAFALYEQGYILIKDDNTKAEGKQCLQQVANYKNYDFEHRLSVRIHSILKHL